VDWYSLLIYYFYFNGDDDAMNNDSKGNDDVINGILVDRIKVKCKKKMEVVQQIFFN
jgi:hypothetical protein